MQALELPPTLHTTANPTRHIAHAQLDELEMGFGTIFVKEKTTHAHTLTLTMCAHNELHDCRIYINIFKVLISLHPGL